MDVRCEGVRAGRATAPGVAFTLQHLESAIELRT